MKRVAPPPLARLPHPGLDLRGLALFGLTLTFLSCRPPAATGPQLDAILADVDGSPITEAAFRRAWSQHAPREGSYENRLNLLEALIHRAQWVRRARLAGLDQDPVVIEAVESILISRLKETELEPALASVGVTATALRSEFEAVKESRFRVPARDRVAVLWLDSRGQPSLEARFRARLEEARDQCLEDPAFHNEPGFGSLAVRNSEHRASRFQGGEIGWIEAGSDDPWRQAIARLAAGLDAPGEISPVATLPEGTFLVRLIARQPTRLPALAEVEPALRRTLEARQRAAIRSQFLDRVRRDSVVHRHTNALAALTGLPAAPPVSTTLSSRAQVPLPLLP